MQIKIAPRSDFPGRGPCIQMWGDWVTEKVWQQVATLMRDNYIDSPVYKARQPSGAFFQGGYNDPKGKWILLEFWAHEDKIQDFLKLLNERVGPLIEPSLTSLRVSWDASEKSKYNRIDMLEMCGMVAQDTKCRIELSDDTYPVIFHPEDNVQHDKVRTTLHGMKIQVTERTEEELTTGGGK